MGCLPLFGQSGKERFEKMKSEKNWLGLSSEKPEEARICILGIPFDGGTSFGKGASMAPERIRYLSSEFMPEASDAFLPIPEHLMFDFGDARVTSDWEDTFKGVTDQAYQIMKQGKFSLFLGGDHSVTIPLHWAFKKVQEEIGHKKIGILHFDAHFDLCHQFDGHRWSHANTEKRALEGIVEPEDLFFLGIRAAEREELEVIQSHPGIQVVTATEVFREGYEKAYERIYNHFKDYDALYFTLDIDVLDPAFAPGTGTPVAGGLSSRELVELVRLIFRDLPVAAMDIVEVSPPLDSNDITSWAAIRVIQEIFARFSK